MSKKPAEDAPRLFRQDFPVGSRISQGRLEAIETGWQEGLRWALVHFGRFGVATPLLGDGPPTFDVEGGVTDGELWVELRSLVAVSPGGYPLVVEPVEPVCERRLITNLTGQRVLVRASFSGWSYPDAQPVDVDPDAPRLRRPRVSVAFVNAQASPMHSRSLIVGAFRRVDGGWRFDRDFVPHVVALRACAASVRWRDELLSKLRRVREQRTPPAPASPPPRGDQRVYNARAAPPASSPTATPGLSRLVATLERSDLSPADALGAVAGWLGDLADARGEPPRRVGTLETATDLTALFAHTTSLVEQALAADLHTSRGRGAYA